MKGLKLAEAQRRYKPYKILTEREVQHPRIFFTKNDILTLRERAHGLLRSEWLALEAEVNDRAGKNLHPSVTLQSACLCCIITDNDYYLDLARGLAGKLMAVRDWAGKPYRTAPSWDTLMGRCLSALAFTYDSLFSQLAPTERESMREQLVHNCRTLYRYYIETDRDWRYQHCHDFVPMLGMALTGYALYGKEPEAEDWLRLAGAFLERTFQCTGTDSWYFEGFEWAGRALSDLAIYAEARYRMTGLKDALSAPLLRQVATYLRHMVLPGGRDEFDFGDVGPSYNPSWKKLCPGEGDEYYFRTTPWREVKPLMGGREGFNITDECPTHVLDLIAARFQDGHTQQLANDLRLRGRNGDSMWSLLWKDPNLKPSSSPAPTSHYFDDHEVAIWRSSWQANATAVAVKCGPPLGHQNAQNLKDIPDLWMRGWHAHPDAGSFILFSHGQYLATDTGACQPKRSVDHNVILINGRGQSRDGYAGFQFEPYERLDKIRLEHVDMQETYMYVVADIKAAYPPELDMKRVTRRIVAMEQCMVVWDILEASYPHDYEWLLHTDTDYEWVEGGYQTRKGEVAMQVCFLHPADLKAEIHKTAVVANGVGRTVKVSREPILPVIEGPPQDRGHHLSARQYGSCCQYVACLTWNWRHEAVADVIGGLDGNRVIVTLRKREQHMSLSMSEMGVKIEWNKVS